MEPSMQELVALHQPQAGSTVHVLQCRCSGHVMPLQNSASQTAHLAPMGSLLVGDMGMHFLEEEHQPHIAFLLQLMQVDSDPHPLSMAYLRSHVWYAALAAADEPLPLPLPEPEAEPEPEPLPLPDELPSSATPEASSVAFPVAFPSAVALPPVALPAVALLPAPAALLLPLASAAVALPPAAAVALPPPVALPAAAEELDAPATVALAATVVSLPSAVALAASVELLSDALDAVSLAEGFRAFAFTEFVSASTAPTWLEMADFDAAADRFSCEASAVLLASALTAVSFRSCAAFWPGVAPFTAVRFTATGWGVVAAGCDVAPAAVAFDALAAPLEPLMPFFPALLVPLAKAARAATEAALADAAAAFAAVALTAVELATVELAEPFVPLVAL